MTTKLLLSLHLWRKSKPLTAETQRRRARQNNFKKSAMYLSALVGIVLLAGCSVQPWVKPYERERLADPMMKFSRDALAEKHFQHVRDVREGARGATGVQGGGCGCN